MVVAFEQNTCCTIQEERVWGQEIKGAGFLGAEWEPSCGPATLEETQAEPPWSSHFYTALMPCKHFPTVYWL